MLIIRLQRAGKKNQAEFRVVLAEKTAAVNKKVTEYLGNYNARKKAFAIKNPERLNYWIAQHVEISPTVHNLLVSNKMLEGGKVKSFSVPKKAPAPEAAAPAAPADQQPAEASSEPAAEKPAEEAPQA